MKNLPPPPPPDPVDSWLEGPIDNQRIHAALEGLPAGFKKELARYVDEDHQTLVTSIVTWVLVNWPDWDCHLANTCPNWLISMTPPAKPFGQMQFTDDFRVPFKSGCGTQATGERTCYPRVGSSSTKRGYRMSPDSCSTSISGPESWV